MNDTSFEYLQEKVKKATEIRKEVEEIKKSMDSLSMANSSENPFMEIRIGSTNARGYIQGMSMNLLFDHMKDHLMHELTVRIIALHNEYEKL